MTKRYTGGVVSSSLPTVNAAGASGVFLLSQQADYQSRNAWPPYKIEESLRFRASATGYLSRTPSTAGNRKIMTLSCWVKRGILGGQPRIFSAGTDNYISFTLTSDAIELNLRNGGSASNVFLVTTQVFRDPSAWYHIVMAIDTTQATASNRVKLYVNGVQVTAFSSANYPTQNNDMNSFNNSVAQYIGVLGDITYPFDGYMSEVNFIDGQALTPSSFGATDKDGNWSPIAYTGTYGNNGFYVNFRDNTSATTMGYDYSGNGNNWTLNGFNVSTANTTYDIMIDVPEDQAGANNRGNYATLNPLSFYNSQTTSINCTNGNLNIKAHTVNGDTRTFGTMGVSTGKWYFESNIVAVDSTYGCVGISDIILAYGQAQNTGNWWVYIADGKKYNGVNPAVGGTSYGNTFTTNDIIGIAVDLDNSKIWFSKNGTYQASGDPVAGTNAAFTNVAGTIYPAVYTWAINSEQALNFGQRPFTYAPPTGFKTLNTFNLPEPTIKQPNRQFDATLYTGTGATLSVTNAGGFQPDFVWLKSRSAATNHQLFDAVRGATKVMVSNSTEAESTSANTITSFNSGGFTVGTNTAINTSAATYVGWQWNAGNSTVTNTTGTISAQVRANPTAGFSIATYTGNGTAGATVGHGLGVAPSMIIIKNRTDSASAFWCVYHRSVYVSGADPNVLYLNSTQAQTDDTNVWGSSPDFSSTIFKLGDYNGSNGSGDSLVAYCFAQIAGYSAFGSYTGNGSTDGPFVYTGFRPRYVIFKNASAAATDWKVFDSSRNTSNIVTSVLYPNLNNAEETNTGLDFLSNGFKWRDNGSAQNGSGNTIIYAAFAEAPFKYARSR